MLRRLHRRAPDAWPWWLAYAFDNPLRRLVHDPAAILGGLVRRGDTVVDVGCGLGFFTVAMAQLVGPDGKVIAVDVRPEMLMRTRRRVERRGLAGRVEFRQAARERLNVQGPVDFVLAFWMVHEVANRAAFLSEVHAILRPTGHLLIAEPNGHVSAALFVRITELARDAGFIVRDGRPIRWSRSVLCVPRPDSA